LRHLYIAEKDRWKDYERGTMRIEQALTYEIDTCRFQVRGEKPLQGEEVIIEDDSVGRMFAGIVVTVELASVMPDKSNCLWQVECDDYTALLDRRLVAEAYENMPADEIFLDIAAKYCPGFTTNGVRSGAPVIESTGAEFEYKRPSECFKWLCDYTGWHWQPDYYKDLHFFSAEEFVTPAPMGLTPGAKFRFGKHSIDTQGLRNRVFVRGGKMLSDEQEFRYVADGEQRLWVLGHQPHSPWVQVGDASAPKLKPGLEFVDEEASYDYMYNQAEKYIRCSYHTPTPVAGTTMIFSYKYPMDVITMVEDILSQQQVAAVQGGDGVYEHQIIDDTLLTIEAAEAAGYADLREHANPRVKGSFETEYIVPAELEAVISGYEDNKDVILDWKSGIEQATRTGSYFLMQDASAGQRFKIPAELAEAEHVRASVLGSEKFFMPPDFIGFHIYNDDNGVPGNTISSTGFATVLGEDWPSNPMEPEWVTVEILLDEPLEEGKHYWLVMVIESATEFGYENAYVKFCTSLSNPYPDGYYAVRTGAGGWSIQAGTDFTFKIEAPIYEQVPIYKYIVQTPAYTWQPGQLLPINLPDRSVTGEFLIQRATITPKTPRLWTYRIEYGGRLLGIADFLKALVSSQQKKHLVDAAFVSKFVYGQDFIAISDTVEIVQRTTSWYCGDEDAICGEIVCLEVSS
jgi:hypothetical protein